MKKISKETLALVNKVREVNNTLSDGGVTCLRYSEVEEMMDALTDVVKFFDLKHQGGISEWERMKVSMKVSIGVIM